MGKEMPTREIVTCIACTLQIPVFRRMRSLEAFATFTVSARMLQNGNISIFRVHLFHVSDREASTFSKIQINQATYDGPDLLLSDEAIRWMDHSCCFVSGKVTETEQETIYFNKRFFRLFLLKAVFYSVKGSFILH